LSPKIEKKQEKGTVIVRAFLKLYQVFKFKKILGVICGK